MNLDNTSTSAALSGFIAGVVITVLSALVFVPAGGSGASNVLAGSQTGSGDGGGGTGLFDGGSGEEGGSGNTDGDGTGLFGDGEASGDATADGSDTTGGSATSGGTTGGSATGGTTGGTAAGGTTGGSTGETASSDSTDDTTTETTSSGTTSGGTTSGGSTGGTTSGGDDGGTTSGGDDGGTTSGGGGQLACQPGSNGGSTDTGITGDTIKLGATIVKDGVGASFLGEATFAMDAVIRKVNASGGICGRQIDIKYKNDSWDAAKGYQYIKDLVEAEQVFALAVVPSSEGLNEASEGGYFERKQVPVVGSDGMIRSQYTDPYIFPVATSTVTLMHVMADHAWNSKGARDFGLVFEKTYRFGVEGAYAFNQAYKRLSGSNIEGYEDPFGSPTCQSGTHFCAIAANQNDYSNENQNFNNGCQDGGCDYVAYLMEPSTALQWFRSGGDPNPAAGWPKGGGAAQPLFTYDFGANCGAPCNGLWLWTGYNPPIEQYADQSGVRQYVNDLHSVKDSADEFNQFTEGAYLGMVSLVEAMAQTGPNLTRERLMDTLHDIEVGIGLSQPLSWEPGDHLANISAQAFSISYKQGFKGWFHEQGYIQDRWAGQDME